MHVWFKHLHENLGWVILAKSRGGGKDVKVQAYLASINHFIDSAEKKLLQTEESDRKADIKILIDNVKVLQKHAKTILQDDMQTRPVTPTQPMGSSCSTVSPNSREACCQKKKADGVEDKWCMENYSKPAPKPTPSMGSSCGTVNPVNREACCKKKKADGIEDKWCMDNYFNTSSNPKPKLPPGFYPDDPKPTLKPSTRPNPVPKPDIASDPAPKPKPKPDIAQFLTWILSPEGQSIVEREGFFTIGAGKYKETNDKNFK